MTYRRLTLITAAIITVMSVWGTGRDNKHYVDYADMLGKVTGQLRGTLKTHPEYHIDSLRAHVTDDIKDGPIGSSKALKARRTKRLTPEQIYELCRRSTLVYGKMEHVPYVNGDSAFSNASAVVLTPDGICATNYHVVADIVLRGALDYKVDSDRARFVMDCDGNAYPVTSVLSVDQINDMAIIKVDPMGKTLTPASIGTDLNPGAPVYCLSNTTGNYFHFTDGQVSNCTRKADKRSGRTQYIMDITADYGVGASGGPIYDECGNLVGLVSSTVSVYADPQQGRNFQMAYKQTVPVFLISDLFTL